MKHIRHLLVVAALVVGSLGFTAAPASACPPDEQTYCPPCGNEQLDAIWQKLTGRPLFTCWY